MEIKPKIEAIFKDRPNLMVIEWGHGVLITYDHPSIEPEEMESLVSLIGPRLEIYCQHFQDGYVKEHFEMQIEAKLEPGQ